jgi:hypothetical protein
MPNEAVLEIERAQEDKKTSIPRELVVSWLTHEQIAVRASILSMLQELDFVKRIEPPLSHAEIYIQQQDLWRHAIVMDDIEPEDYVPSRYEACWEIARWLNDGLTNKKPGRDILVQEIKTFVREILS